MLDQIRVVISIGLVMLLLLLRLESEQFGAAEYDESDNRFKPGLSRRLSWYAIGLLLLAGLYVVHPKPHEDLYLVLGQRGDILLYGLLLAVVGMAQAAAFSFWHYRRLRLPPAAAYPGAGINDIMTAVIDEATFRGAILGLLLVVHVPVVAAVMAQAVLYALVTRLGAPGRHPYMLLLSLGIGLACGWATIRTGGIGAAIIGHAMTSYALFVFSGHAGQIVLRGKEPEEIERGRRAPDGWQDVRRLRPRPHSNVTAEPRGLSRAATSGVASAASAGGKGRERR